jgi:hypothetical protein
MLNSAGGSYYGKEKKHVFFINQINACRGCGCVFWEKSNNYTADSFFDSVLGCVDPAPLYGGPPSNIENSFVEKAFDFANKKHKPPKIVVCDSCKNRGSAIDVLIAKEKRYLLNKRASLWAQNNIQKSEPAKPDVKKAMPAQKFLYLMKCGRTGFYKIGISCDPKFRESTLQCESPSIKLVGKWNGGAENYEKHWHEWFAPQRVRGEWFNLAELQVRFFVHRAVKHSGLQ